MQKQLEGTYLRREAPKQQKYYDDMFALVLNLNVKNSWNWIYKGKIVWNLLKFKSFSYIIHFKLKIRIRIFENCKILYLVGSISLPNQIVKYKQNYV